MLSSDEFDQLALEVWRELWPLVPPELAEHIQKVQILIEDSPSSILLEDLKGSGLDEAPEELCGLHVGVPLIDESVVFPHPFPARVYLFRKALIELALDDEDRPFLETLREEIAITLLHEIGHFFGLEEEDLERLGYD